jgi:Dyp-type peroxidase family
METAVPLCTSWQKGEASDMPNTPLFQLNHSLTNADLKAYKAELSLLQGNILKTHGRGVAVHLFLTFHPRKQAEVKQFLRKSAGQVTSTTKQLAQARRFRKTQQPEHQFTSLCLSATGYRYLGLSTKDFSLAFRRGMRSAKLDDPPLKKWEPKFQKAIHAMLLLADDRVEKLTEELIPLRKKLDTFADVSIEFGLTMRNQAQNPIEHFGYADGVSQPLFFASDLKKAPKKWDPSAGPNLVLVEDPHGGSRTACGTYLVFRKLEQNVRAFAARELALADALKLQGDDRELAGAMVVGRFEDGTPVELHRKARNKIAPENDFTYARDPGGNKCPFAGHIRKTNPRTDDGKSHRIARRGITYGDPTPPGDDLAALPETGVGLLFQSCQADLRKQFEILQRSWANDHAPLRPGTGKDPMIGQSARGQFPGLEFPDPWGSAERTPFSFHSFVTMKGGEYFFVPSIRFLKNLE